MAAHKMDALPPDLGFIDLNQSKPSTLNPQPSTLNPQPK
jgi:hypothetical protein